MLNDGFQIKNIAISIGIALIVPKNMYLKCTSFILLSGLIHWNCAIDYTTAQKFGVKGFLMFFEGSLFCSPMLHLFDQKYSKKCEILLEFKTAVFYVNMC